VPACAQAGLDRENIAAATIASTANRFDDLIDASPPHDRFASS
jgi:hypothetical protein